MMQIGGIDNLVLKDVKFPEKPEQDAAAILKEEDLKAADAAKKDREEAEKQKFAKMGLHSNPYATGDYFTRDYLCLNCGIKWNGKMEGIYRDMEEIK